MNKGVFNFSTDKILSVSAIIIAIASIFVAIWQGIETRKHYRLSVRPKLQITFNVDKEKFGYIILNNGLGPATISGKKIFIDGEEMTNPGFSGYDELIDKLDFKNRQKSHSALNPGTTIKAGETKDIFLVNKEQNDNLHELLPAIYQRIAFEISYKSMYNEEFVYKFPD
jgi:hypothetical protein